MVPGRLQNERPLRDRKNPQPEPVFHLPGEAPCPAHPAHCRPPVRESGDIAGSGACKLVGPAGEVEVAEGVIAAKRHIHMTPADAAEFGVKDKDVVSVKVNTNGRALVFGDVVVRVSEKFSLAMHIDTDESNAACAVNGTMGELVK